MHDFRCNCLTSCNLLTPHHSLQKIWEKGNDSCSGQPVSPSNQPIPWLSHNHTTRVCSQTSSPWNAPCIQEGKQGPTLQKWFVHQQCPLRKAMSIRGAHFYWYQEVMEMGKNFVLGVKKHVLLHFICRGRAQWLWVWSKATFPRGCPSSLAAPFLGGEIPEHDSTGWVQLKAAEETFLFSLLPLLSC